MGKKKKKQIFISHISEEEELAFLIKEWIEERFNYKLSVFVSSESIKPGDKWRQKITSALEESELLIILYSPLSKTRPWINFEAGCGWIKDIPIIPICHSNLRLEQIGEPISSFQGIEIDDKNFVLKLCRAILKHTDVFPQFSDIDLHFIPISTKDEPPCMEFKIPLCDKKLRDALRKFYPTDNF
jgi:hypothetical protein